MNTTDEIMERVPTRGTHPLMVMLLFGGVLGGIIYTGSNLSKKNASGEAPMIVQTSTATY